MKIWATLAFFALLLTNAQASAQPGAEKSVSSQDAIIISNSGKTEEVDCGGKDLMVSGNENTLQVRDCATVSVVGNRNKVHLQALPTTSIAALGNNNFIVFLHALGIEVQVSSSGSDNEIVPSMSKKDMERTPLKSMTPQPR